MQITSCRETLTVICHDFPKARRLVLAMGVSENRSLAYHHKVFKRKESGLSSYDLARYRSFFENMKEWYELYRDLHASDADAKKSWQYWVSHATEGLKDGTYRTKGGKVIRKSGSVGLTTVKLKISKMV